MTRGVDEVNSYRLSWGSLTATQGLSVERLGIVFVEDMGSNVGGVVVDHRCFRRPGVGGGEEGRGERVCGVGIEEARSQWLLVLYRCLANVQMERGS